MLEQIRLLDFDLRDDPRFNDPKRLLRHQTQICSQNGEDGIIHEIFKRIGTTSKVFVEIGVGDGRENNTAFLLSQGWRGFWFDGGDQFLGSMHGRRDLADGCLRHHIGFVTRENVAGLFGSLGVPAEFDLLSVDIDQNTYHVWEGLKAYRPRVVVVEYNAALPPDIDWKVNYERAMENGMDGSHAAFVHGSRFGNIKDPSVPDFDVTTTPWSGLSTIPLKAPPKNLGGLWGKLFKFKYKKEVGDGPVLTHVKAGYFLPNINVLYVPLPIGNMVLIDAHVPVDENHTRSMYIGLRDFIKAEWADKDTHKRIQDIFKQDDSVLKKQRPEILPYQLSDELHIRSDILQTTYRRRRNELLDQGWGIDMHQIVGDGPRDVAVVIPSPARKNNPELANAWVHKEVNSKVILGGSKAATAANAGGKTAYEIEES